MVGYAVVTRTIRVRVPVPEPVFQLAGCERCEARLTAALRGAAGAEAGGRPASWDEYPGDA